MNAGTLSRIISVRGDIITVDFDAMRDMTPEKRLQYMIAAGNYNWVDYPFITTEHFPIEGTGKMKFRCKLFGSGCYVFSVDAAVAAMKKENFTQGSHVHGLAFGAMFPKEQFEGSIACLGWFAHVRGRRFVVYLEGSSLGRSLYVGVWPAGPRFLGVQEVSDA